MFAASLPREKPHNDSIELSLVGGAGKDSTIEDTPIRLQDEENATAPIESRGFSKLGIILGVTCTLPGIVNGALSKYLYGVSSSQMLFVRCSMVVVLFLAYFAKTGQIKDIKPSIGGRMLLLGTVWSLSNLLYFVSMNGLSLSELSTIYSAAAISTGLLASLILKEPYSRLEKIVGCICLVGVLFIVRPPALFGGSSAEVPTSTATMSRFVAGLIAIVCTVTLSGTQIIIRGFKTKHDPEMITFFVQILGSFWYGLYVMLFDNYNPMTSGQYFIILITSLLSTLNIFLNTKALEIERPSVVGLLGYFQLVFSLILDIVLFAEFPGLLSVVGAFLIVGSCIYLIMHQKQ